MSPHPPHDDPTTPHSSTTANDSSDTAKATDDASATNASSTTSVTNASSTTNATSDNSTTKTTRRQLVRSIGAGAALLGGSTALSGSAAGQEAGVPPRPRVEGIEDWSITRETIDSEEVQDGPTVTFEDDEVVVTGSKVFSRTGCDTFVPQRIVYSDGASRLGVIVDEAPTYTPDRDDIGCLTALMPLRYELRVTPESFVQGVVVEEAFSDDGPSFHPRTGRSGPEPLPVEVDDYEFTVGASVGPDTAEVLTPSKADEMEPTVTFDGDDVIVQGAMTYGSSSCDEIALTGIRREYDVEGHVGVQVQARRTESWMPGDGCTADIAATYYRLELTGSGKPPIERCSVTESGANQTHRLLVEDADADLELPDGVRDHRLEIDQSGASYDDQNADPTVTFESSEDAGVAEDTVVVEGTTSAGSSSCDTLAVGDLRWESGEGSHLVARVDTARRREGFDACTDDVVTVDYRLELTVDQLPATVTAQEGHERSDEPQRSVTVEREDDGGPELPDGVVDLEFTTDRDADEEDVEADPTVTADESAAPPVVTAEGAMLVSPCHELAVTDVRWADDGHLVVAVDAVSGDGYDVSFSECPLDALPRRVGYTVDLVVESLPEFATAEEPHEYSSEPARSTTVEFEAEGPCADAADTAEVDGQTVCDLDGDGSYRDVNGDGTVSNGDVTDFFGNQHAPAWDERIELFDFDGDDEVGQSDVIDLFQYVNG